MAKMYFPRHLLHRPEGLRPVDRTTVLLLIPVAGPTAPTSGVGLRAGCSFPHAIPYTGLRP